MVSTVTARDPAGRCTDAIRCYFGDPPVGQRGGVRSHDLRPRRVELRFDPDSASYRGEIKPIRVGTELRFQALTADNRTLTLVPIEEPETVFGKVRVPDLDPDWQAASRLDGPANSAAEGGFQILLEATPEGLLADDQGGAHAPAAIEDLLGPR